jgi:hypothetical protein
MVVLWEENLQFGKEIRSRIPVFSSDTCGAKALKLLIEYQDWGTVFILKIPLPPPPVLAQVIDTKLVNSKVFKTWDLADAIVEFAGVFGVFALLKFANKSICF